ncbi:ABC1 kinase family protein [Mycolicibacterium brumae]|nr:AarF/ABC1/UbiB kinase family protein [Mycolicibacterium brumae]RWA19610.1 hypothetical protein MBRU_16765 [Mycolicibacterium brumae DSM 44177]UWW08307.1 AarF/ABC1/UbiB kinase family protein [Mycolicibacterium brumae]
MTGDPPVPQGRLRRVMPLAGLAARTAGGRLVAGVQELAGDPGAVRRFHARTADRYVELLGNSKGALMKIGQILSMVDLDGPSPYQQAFARLQSDAPPMHPDLVRAQLVSEIGPPERHFAEFDVEPIAAASVGQVHRGVLHDGRPVAVKVQYPGVAEAIRADLDNAELLRSLILLVMSVSGTKIDITAVAEEVRTRVGEELDYRHEAVMLARFAELYRDHPFIHIPDAIPEASGGRVLTMTYLDGLDWASARQADQQRRDIWAESLLRYCQANFRHSNLIDVDLHPGNFRFLPDGALGVLDFGCVQVVPEQLRWVLVALMRATIDGRQTEVRRLMVRSKMIAADSPLTVEQAGEFCRGMIVDAVAPQPVTFSPEFNARKRQAMLGELGLSGLTKIRPTPEAAFLPRIQVAMDHLFTGLRATVPVRSVLDDMDGVAEPVTELGRRHHAWARERGLPGALEHHREVP